MEGIRQESPRKDKFRTFFFFDLPVELTIGTHLDLLNRSLSHIIIAVRPRDHPAGSSGIFSIMHAVEFFRLSSRTDPQFPGLFPSRLSPALKIFPAILFHKPFQI